MVVTLGIVVVLAAGWFLKDSYQSWQKGRRLQLLQRISTHLRAAPGPMQKEPPMYDLGRREIIQAINTALWNWPLYDARGTVPGKVEAIANRLDATSGADLQTFAGCVQLLGLCDEASWTFYDYPWVTALYDLEREGSIPKLPVLGERWKNDERRKKWDSHWATGTKG